MTKLAVSGAALSLIAFLSGCTGAGTTATTEPPSAAASASPAATTTNIVTATPTPIATTGAYQADLASLGVVPDDVQSFADFMKKQICTRTGTSLGISVRSMGGNDTGGGVDGVRLTVEYFCPEKSREVESYLEYFKE